jgi:hypothetical protein
MPTEETVMFLTMEYVTTVWKIGKEILHWNDKGTDEFEPFTYAADYAIELVRMKEYL